MNGFSINKPRLHLCTPCAACFEQRLWPGCADAKAELNGGQLPTKHFLETSTPAFFSLRKPPIMKVQLFSGFWNVLLICMCPSELKMLRHSSLLQCLLSVFRKLSGFRNPLNFNFYFCSYPSSTED